MNREELIAEFASLNVWKSGDQRAPHKPLLLLLALGRAARGEDRLMEFAAIEEKLRDLLEEFGPPSARQTPHLPFWHLRTDGIWQIEGLPGIEGRAPGDSARITELRAGVRGGLEEHIHRAVREDPDLLRELAQVLLDAHFPERTYHEDIASAVGVELGIVTRRRDPRFRDRVLVAYGFSCAVCGFDLRLKHAPLAVEAAHIKWHQAGGPSIAPNGLALCTMHHKLFDRGAMAVSEDRRIVVSNLVNGSTGFDEYLGPFNGKALREPQSPDQVPLEQYVRWHVREVFRGDRLN